MKDEVIPLGLEISNLSSEAGNLIGRDPDTLTSDEWLQLGSEFPVGLKAIRAKCLDCAHTPGEVRRCVCMDCPLWPLRLGRVPKAYRRALEKARHALVNDELLSSLRGKWRDVPDHAKDEVPDLVSMVSLDENSSIIPISRTANGFCIELPQLSVAFRNLQDAEMFLAGYLLEHDGVDWNTEWPPHA